jgi:hypothetical protein
MLVSRNTIGLLALFAIQALVFYSQYAAQVAPYYPTTWDQLAFFSRTYELTAAFYSQGWSGLTSQFGDAPQGATLPIQGALLAIMGGENRTTIVSLNLVYFLALQATVFWTVRARTGKAYLSWVAIALIISLVALFQAGGMYDFRTDFVVMCLYGIWVCAIINSDSFKNVGWSLAVGALGALLVSMRFVALVYAGPALFLFFLFLLALRIWGSVETRQVANCFLSGVIILAVAAPLIFMARHMIYQYYVIGHVTGDEPNVRAAELGIHDGLGHLLYYPTNIVWGQLGSVSLSIACMVVVVALLLGRDRWRNFKSYRWDLATLALFTIVPIAAFASDVSKSPVVGNTVVVPIILAVILLGSSAVPRLLAWTVAGVGMVWAFPIFLSHAHTPQHFLTKDDLKTVDRLRGEIVKYVIGSGISSPRFAFDRVDDYLNTPMVLFDYLEASDRRHLKPLTVNESMGGLLRISRDAAINAVKNSDVVVLTDQFKGRDKPYPFNESMKETWPEIAQHVQANLLEIASGNVSGIPYRVFVNAYVQLSGQTVDNWILDSGIVVSADPFFLKSRPLIVLEGRLNEDPLRGRPIAKASLEDGSILPASLTSKQGRYRLEIDASTLADDASSRPIAVTFDRYFVPSELGVNADTRHLVVEGPDTRSLAAPK